MTSISQKTDERKPRHLKLATVLALGATAVLAGNALLIRNTEPALAVSENVASASAFRILTPQAIDRLAGLSGPVAPGEDAATGVSAPANDETSCIAIRAARRTDRYEALEPKAFCQLQHRLFNAELIDRIAALQLASQPDDTGTSSQLAMNKEF